jgi:hypothetical protein
VDLVVIKHLLIMVLLTLEMGEMLTLMLLGLVVVLALS